MKFASKLALYNRTQSSAGCRYPTWCAILNETTRKKTQSSDVEILEEIHTKFIQRLNELSRIFLLDKANICRSKSSSFS